MYVLYVRVGSEPFRLYSTYDVPGEALQDAEALLSAGVIDEYDLQPSPSLSAR